MKLGVKSRKWLLGGFLALAAILLGKFMFFPTKSVPNDFVEARSRGTEVAQQIVALSNSVLRGISDIARYDQEGNTTEALLLVANNLVQNKKNQEQSILLASNLERMARFVPNIKPARARQLATAAVGAEVALVSRLISYNDYLRQLFEVLNNKFDRGYAKSVDAEHIDLLISKINEEAAAINNLNQRFNDALAEFDKLIK